MDVEILRANYFLFIIIDVHKFWREKIRGKYKNEGKKNYGDS
jgi:hypothetical protein